MNQSENSLAVDYKFSDSQKGSLYAALKLFTNSKFIDLTPEINLGYVFNNDNEQVNYSMAIGLCGDQIFNENFDQISLVIPLSIEVHPLSDLRNLSFIFELAPKFEFEGDVMLRSLLGIKYSF